VAHTAACGQDSAPRRRLEVADVFRSFGEAYTQSHLLTREQVKAFDAILACRTARLGGHLDCCQDCGFERPAYNSCRNRHCPKCQGIAAARWVEARRHTILPVHYFHVVFTLPAELRPLALRNRELIFDLLFEAVSGTLLTLGADPDRLGALLGFSAVLHTWTRDLSFHPHLHCIVTGGGLSPDGQSWTRARGDCYLFPVQVMGRLFRGKFLAGLQRLYHKGALHLGGSCAQLDDPDVFRLLLDQLYRTEWRPYAKRPFAGPQQVYEYLGYYTHRVGIANHRLLEIDENSVRFKTRNGKTATLKAEEFIRRFLLHVLPTGFVKIRHYGLLAAKANAKRQAVRAALPPGPDAPPAPKSTPERQSPRDERLAEPLARLLDLALRCPRCGKSALLRRPLHERAPPSPQEVP
jgi:predicted Zn-ribbon and HTH transcriptional regulator